MSGWFCFGILHQVPKFVTCCLHRQLDVGAVGTKDRGIQREPDSVDLKTEALGMSETSEQTRDI